MPLLSGAIESVPRFPRGEFSGQGCTPIARNMSPRNLNFCLRSADESFIGLPVSWWWCLEGGCCNGMAFSLIFNYPRHEASNYSYLYIHVLVFTYQIVYCSYFNLIVIIFLRGRRTENRRPFCILSPHPQRIRDDPSPPS